MTTLISKIAACIGVCTMTALTANADGIQKFSFQGCEIVCIQDVAMKHPQNLFSDIGNSGFRQQSQFYDSSINVFLIRKDGKTMLVDAGNDQSRGSLHGKLQQAKVRSEDVSDIFITHIHPDHVGGLLWEGRALFPNATLHIAREEINAWRKDARRAALAKYLAPYEKHLHSFAFTESLPCGIIPVKRGGHTPGHTIFRLPLANQPEAIFVGDIVHGVELQFPYPTFCARYDSAPQEAVASRLQTLQMKGILFGAHFPFPGVAEGGVVLKKAPNWSFEYRRFTLPAK